MGILSSIGIGNATVDLVVPDDTVTAGETKQCYVEVEGGREAQDVEDIYAALRTHYLTPEGHHEVTIKEYELTGAFTIHVDEHREIEVEIDIPEETPVTRGKTKVWIGTGLDIDWATHPEDKDVLNVSPSPLVAALNQAIETLDIQTEAHEPVASVGTPLASHGAFAQEITLQPSESDDEMYVVYTVHDGTLYVGLHRGDHDGVGPFTVEEPDSGQISKNIRRLMDEL